MRRIFCSLLIVAILLLVFYGTVFAVPEALDDLWLFENHGSVMLIIEADSGAIVYANNAAVGFYGHPADVLQSMNINQINTLPPEEVEAEWQAAAAEERNFFNFRHQLANGEIRHVEVYSYPFTRAGVAYLHSIITDVTERVLLAQTLETRNRTFYMVLVTLVLIQLWVIHLLRKSLTAHKKTEVSLQESKDRYAALFDNMQEGFALHEIICDDNGKPVDYRYLDINQAFEKITGLKRESVVGKQVSEIFPDLDASWVDPYGQVALTMVPISFENYNKELDKHFAVNAFSPRKGEFATIFFDVTENKKLERGLWEEKERLQITLLSVGDGVISTDELGNVAMINEVAASLTGWTPQDAVGKPFRQVFHIINELTREECEDPVETVLSTGKVIGLANHTTLIARDGRETPIADSAAPILDEQGTVQGVVLVFRDVSDEKSKRERIEFLSYHDQLTGLYNRRFFEEELRRLDTPRNLPMSIVMADVNGLKLTNDAFGHVAGDRLLKKTAEILKSSCRADDIIARLGGDEFIILLPKTQAAEAKQIVARIKEASQEVRLESGFLSISLGWDTKQDENEHMDNIFKKAEDYMYRQKLFESPSVRGKTIYAIINTLHERNKREEQHSNRVSRLCEAIGTALGLPERELQDLKTAGLLHDIGKIAVNETILNKDRRLDKDEWKEIKRHPEIGYRILSSVNDMAELADIVLAHHERWDGKGYPKNLAGEQIPLFARIIAIADAYEAMTSERAYRPVFSEEQAALEIIKNAGSQFDPELARHFVDVVLKGFCEIRQWPPNNADGCQG